MMSYNISHRLVVVLLILYSSSAFSAEKKTVTGKPVEFTFPLERGDADNFSGGNVSMVSNVSVRARLEGTVGIVEVVNVGSIKEVGGDTIYEGVKIIELQKFQNVASIRMVTGQTTGTLDWSEAPNKGGVPKEFTPPRVGAPMGVVSKWVVHHDQGKISIVLKEVTVEITAISKIESPSVKQEAPKGKKGAVKVETLSPDSSDDEEVKSAQKKDSFSTEKKKNNHSDSGGKSIWDRIKEWPDRFPFLVVPVILFFLFRFVWSVMLTEMKRDRVLDWISRKWEGRKKKAKETKGTNSAGKKAKGTKGEMKAKETKSENSTDTSARDKSKN